MTRPKSARSPGTPRLQDTVRLSADGLAKVLGDLEARIMRLVWRLDRPASARTVHDHVVAEHDVALLTVVTVLNNLVKKGLLARSKRDDLLHYTPRMTMDAFLEHASRRVVEGVWSLAPDAVAASLVDVLAEHDPDRLAELGKLVRRKLREQE